jgi:hypothetical protein
MIISRLKIIEQTVSQKELKNTAKEFNKECKQIKRLHLRDKIIRFFHLEF